MSGVRQVVVEADGGSRGNPGPAGYGAVVIDPATGEPLAEAAEYIGVATNNVAEYRGLIAGLTAAKALFPDAGDALRVHVRMDSKLVVEQGARGRGCGKMGREVGPRARRRGREELHLAHPALQQGHHLGGGRDTGQERHAGRLHGLQQRVHPTPG
ncbi:Ribonuclease H [Streptomyces griseus subsp. griseus]